MSKLLKYSIGIILSLGLLSSCYEYDPIEAKERMLASLKLKPKPVTPPEPPVVGPTIEPNTGGGEKGDDEFVTMHFGFDIWKQKANEPYFIPMNNPTEDPANSFWVSASNRGYTNFTSKLSEFPVLELKEGYKGSGVKLISRPPVGGKAAFAPKLLAGSLYSGLVVGNKMSQNPAYFGHSWKYEPTQLKLFYKYKAGDQAINGLVGNDKGAVNAVLYDISYDESYLDKKTIKNSDRIVLQAYKQLEDVADWTELILDFKPVNQSLYKQLDMTKRKYRLAIIFSSSAKGDVFIGALGSTLCIDELTLVSKNNKPKQTGGGSGGTTPQDDKVEVTSFDFNSWKQVSNTKGRFSTPILSSDENPSQSYWQSQANFTFDKEGGNYDYPVQELKNAWNGSGIKLISRSNYPRLPYKLIPGEIYNGSVNPKRIGRDWAKGEPQKISFHYKYKAGEPKLGSVYGKLEGADKGLVKAMLYEVTDNEGYYLNDAELKKAENDRIVLEIEQVLGETDWGKELTLDFSVANETRYKALDFNNKKYRLAIIFTSSYKSLEGKGVWDSCLQIDELNIYSKKK